MSGFRQENLTRIIDDNNIDRNKLAKKLGKSIKDIEQYESGEKKPRPDTIKKIAKALDVEPIYLYRDIEEVDEKVYENVYESVSRYIWDLLKDANVFDISLREETMTETSLLQIRKMIPRNFFVQQIPGQTENKIGADWEWFVIKEGKWLGFRIQAKRLSVKKQHASYESLHYPKGEREEKENQCQTLILDSWTNNRIPLYCFYNYLPDELVRDLFKPNIQTKGASVVKESIKIDSSGLGWLFCYADHLFPTKKYYKDKDNFQNVLPFTKNFKLMFSRDFEEIVNEYNRIKRDDDDNHGKGKEPNPGDPPVDDPKGEKIKEYLNEKHMPKEEFWKCKKGIEIKVKGIDELPIYAKKYLKENTALQFGKYDNKKIEESKIPPIVVYSIFENMPFTSMNVSEYSVESGQGKAPENIYKNEQEAVVSPVRRIKGHNEGKKSKNKESESELVH